MSFFKNAGKNIGKGAGLVLGGSIKVAGKAVNSDFVQEVGDSVDNSMQNTGELLGNVVDGVADIGAGSIESDDEKRKQGFDNLSKTASTVGDQLLMATGQVLESAINTADGVLEKDWEKVKTSGRSLAKVAVVSTVAIGLVDIVDGVDGADLSVSNEETTLANNQIENPNTHEVSPHERVLPSGEKIWVDGDGDTSIDRDTGWVQTNPNYRV